MTNNAEPNDSRASGYRIMANRRGYADELASVVCRFAISDQISMFCINTKVPDILSDDPEMCSNFGVAFV